MPKARPTKSVSPRITFELEPVEPAENLLYRHSVVEIIDRHFSGATQYRFPVDELVAHASPVFLSMLYRAWSDHRPIVISPDMIWLVICQGFSAHVHANAPELRSLVMQPDHDGGISVTLPGAPKGAPLQEEWIFALFEENIRSAVKPELVNTLLTSFSTTTPTIQIASLVTLMATMDVFLQYHIDRPICGITHVTLEGSKSDWEKIEANTRDLRGYGLDDWIEQLLPILGKFTETAAGSIDIDFWRGIFKVYDPDPWPEPAPNSRGRRRRKSPYDKKDQIDGWVTTFYPYNKDGTRRNVGPIRLKSLDRLPSDMLKTPITMDVLSADGSQPLEKQHFYFHAGFLGSEQDPDTMALKPVIGWIIEPNPEAKAFPDQANNMTFRNLTKFPQDLLERMTLKKWPEEFCTTFPEYRNFSYREGLEFYHMTKGPEHEQIRELLLKHRKELPRVHVRYLRLYFAGKIDIPDELAGNWLLSRLYLEGEISESEIERIRRLLPCTTIEVNGIEYPDYDC